MDGNGTGSSKDDKSTEENEAPSVEIEDKTLDQLQPNVGATSGENPAGEKTIDQPPSNDCQTHVETTGTVEEGPIDQPEPSDTNGSSNNLVTEEPSSDDHQPIKEGDSLRDSPTGGEDTCKQSTQKDGASNVESQTEDNTIDQPPPNGGATSGMNPTEGKKTDQPPSNDCQTHVETTGTVEEGPIDQPEPSDNNGSSNNLVTEEPSSDDHQPIKEGDSLRDSPTGGEDTRKQSTQKDGASNVESQTEDNTIDQPPPNGGATSGMNPTEGKKTDQPPSNDCQTHVETTGTVEEGTIDQPEPSDTNGSSNNPVTEEPSSDDHQPIKEENGSSNNPVTEEPSSDASHAPNEAYETDTKLKSIQQSNRELQTVNINLQKEKADLEKELYDCKETFKLASNGWKTKREEFNRELQKLRSELNKQAKMGDNLVENPLEKMSTGHRSPNDQMRSESSPTQYIEIDEATVKENQTLKEKITTLKDELQGSEQLIDKLLKENDSNQKNVREMTRQYDDLSSTMAKKDMSNQLELQNLRSELKKKTESKDELTRQLANLQETGKKAKEKNLRSETLKRKSEDANSKIQKLNREKDNLRADYDKYRADHDKYNKHLQARIKTLMDKIDESNRTENNLRRTIEDGENNFIYLTNQYHDKVNQIQRLQRENTSLTGEKQELLLRLSKVAGANLTYDNPNIADLSDEKRPTKLAEEFSELYDNEWTDAFEELQFEKEDKKTTFMLHILKEASHVCSDFANGHSRRIKDSFCTLTATIQTKQATNEINSTNANKSTEEQKLDDELPGNKLIDSNGRVESSHKIQTPEAGPVVLKSDEANKVPTKPKAFGDANEETTEPQATNLKNESQDVNTTSRAGQDEVLQSKKKYTSDTKPDEVVSIDAKIETCDHQATNLNNLMSNANTEEANFNEVDGETTEPHITKENITPEATHDAVKCEEANREQTDPQTTEEIKGETTDSQATGETTGEPTEPQTTNEKKDVPTELQSTNARKGAPPFEPQCIKGERVPTDYQATEEGNGVPNGSKDTNEKKGASDAPQGTEERKGILTDYQATNEGKGVTNEPKFNENGGVPTEPKENNERTRVPIEPKASEEEKEVATEPQPTILNTLTPTAKTDAEKSEGVNEGTNEPQITKENDTSDTNNDSAKSEAISGEATKPEITKDQEEQSTNKTENDGITESKSNQTAVYDSKKEDDIISTQEISIELDFDSLQKEQKKTIMDVKNSFLTTLKNEIEATVTDHICKAFKLNKDHQGVLVKYTEKCVNICWSMCRHNPPVHVEFPEVTENMPFDTNKFKPYTKSGKYIDFIVWPALFLHEGGPLLCKGVAQGEGKDKQK